LLTVFFASGIQAEEALPIGDLRQLFIDGRFLQNSRGVELAVHRPVKTGQKVITCEHSWEQRLGYYHSVLKEGATYHMWYTVCQETDDVNVLLRRVAYARSSDGIHWEKPVLGLVEVNGTRNNNVVLGPGFAGLKGATHGCMVFLDPQAPADQRFRLVSNPKELGKRLQLFSSPDGIHWRLTHRDVMKFRSEKHHLDSQNVIFWDKRIHKYVAYVRKNLRPPFSQGRSIARAESDDLARFPDVEDSPVVLGFDENDPLVPDPYRDQSLQMADFYTNGTFPYPWAQDAYYMFPSEYFHYIHFLKDFRKKRPVNAGSLDVRFAASRDGMRWHRFDRRSFVGLGAKEDWDSMSIYMAYGIVPAPDDRDLYMYYVGSNALHGWNRDDHRNRESNNRLLRKVGLAPEKEEWAISRLRIRRDGFISARSAYTGGEFTTPRITFQGDQLALNLNTSAVGWLQVEILDSQNKPIPGYALADCDHIYTANEINRVVKWNGNSTVTPLAGKPVRLHFVMRDTDLYAFQFRSSRPM